MVERVAEIRVWWSADDDCYVADVPTKPGCIAHGRTRARAVASIREALALRLDVEKEQAAQPHRAVPANRTGS